MQEWIIIASADINWGIGFQNHLLARIPEDMKQVSGKTRGKVIVMRRKTLESFPGGKPLPDRTNIVLTRNRQYSVEGAIVVHDTQELTDTLRNYSGEVYIFGGESIYKQLLPFCTKAYITQFDSEFPADAFLPRFDTLNGWVEAVNGEWQISKTGLSYRFVEYKMFRWYISVRFTSQSERICLYLSRKTGGGCERNKA